ncbi:MAG: tetratricopeptide repeat protein [Kordia sp.]|uniref:tetratricopeptide repeat-containing sensor histidine kinase n=1 Tax=Kordia sp. TaxID=1965332 RepID=UPI0038582DEE
MNFITKCTLFFLCLICTIVSVNAQNKVIDSLENVLEIHKENDSIKVDLLNKLALRYKSVAIDKSEKKAQEANRLAIKIKYTKGVAKSILILSKIHIVKAEYKEAEDKALEALELFKKTDNYKDIIAVYNTLGMISGTKNKPDESLAYFKKSLTIAKNNNDFEYQGLMLTNIGITFYKRGDFDDAVAYYKQSIEIYEKLGDNQEIAKTLGLLAVVLTIQGNYAEALKYFNGALVEYRKNNNKRRIASTVQNMGILYAETGKYKEAYINFNEALQLYKELKYKYGIATTLNSIGDVYRESKEYKKALQHFTEALSINKEINNIEGQITNYDNIGVLHFTLEQPKLALDNYKLALNLSISNGRKHYTSSCHIYVAEVYNVLKNYTKALYHVKEGKKIADDLQLLPDQKKASRLLSEIYEATGKYEKSLKQHKLYKKLNDSIFNKENIQKITAVEYEYKYKQELDAAKIKELELAKTVEVTSLDLEKSQRNLLIGVIIFLATALVMAAIIFFMKLRNVKTKAQNVVIEQKLLRSQMTPHFIFNSLSVLQGMILNKEEKAAVSYLSKFSKLLRKILENSRYKSVSLSDELAAIDSYMGLQNLDVNPPFKFTLTVAPEIDTTAMKIAPMLIQPFVENAIEHAFPTQKEAKEITIDLTFTNKRLKCTITDNGIGINMDEVKTQKNKKSLATAITSERLKILSKSFKKEGFITVKNRKELGAQGTLVSIEIPYLLEEIEPLRISLPEKNK